MTSFGAMDLRYEVERELGPSVWLARDRLQAGRVVLKRPAADQPALLEQEHDHTLALAHPRVRALLGAFRDERGPALILEHVEGARPPADRATAIALLRVLLHLHDRGFVHGDVKPDNVLVDADGTLRLIDLALMARSGQPVRGGTPGFLAPEYLRGAPASVAGDLFGFGRTLRALGTLAADPPLEELVARACDVEPARRPASAAAALAALDAVALPEDRAGVLPRIGPDPIDDLDRAPRRGETRILLAPPRAGRSRIATALRRRFALRWEPLLDLSLEPGALDRLARLTPTRGDRLADRVMSAGIRLADRGLTVLVDDADHADEDDRDALIALARAFALRERGALVLVGADRALADALADDECRVHTLAPLDAGGVEQLLVAAGARVHARLVAGLLARSEGRAGLVAEAAMALARDPERADADWLAAVRVAEARATARQRAPATSAATPAAALAEAEEAIAQGEGRRAVRILRAAFGDEAPPALLARGLELSGRLEEAAEVLAPIADRHGNWCARIAAQLGRYEEALAQADDTPAGWSVAAGAALALGRLESAASYVRRGLDEAESDEDRARFWLLSSDVALRAGRPADAKQAAMDARGLAPNAAMVAEAESRLGSASALSGDPDAARTHHRLALEAAYEAGQVTALPSYVVNVATAHHALGELGDAIARYEEAARLSAGLGRGGMHAVALVNLAGLLVSIGARDEAAAVIDRAKEACARCGSRLYAAQAELIDGERMADTDLDLALRATRRARSEFEACGAGRQALEATLLEAELTLEPSLVRARRGELDEAGLDARASLLEARHAEAQGALDEAAHHAEAARARCHEGTLEARVHRLLARVADARGQRAEADLHRREAHAALGRVAETLPPGLRERLWLEEPSSAPTAQAPAVAPASLSLRALGEGGRRLLGLLRRVLLEPDERRVLEAAVDEAVALTRAERAFLLRRRPDADAILVARNLDRDTIRSRRFSRSVAERVLESGDPVLTEMATLDPSLSSARSIMDLGLRSIVCVPVRGPDRVIGALYLDHRFETARFDREDLEVVAALADIIGMALENGRLHREALERERALEQSNREIRDENMRAAIRLERLEQRLSSAEDEVLSPSSGIVGRSRAIRRAIGVARRVAPSDLSVLIQGESGTGKELFARFVHEESHRRDGPFLAINCGALPEPLLESELFGHVRGAFTGAHRDHPGLFRSAQGGTLFLDEVGEMPPTMQARLLRVLQEREVRSVGADHAEAIDVRVVAATNRDLERGVAEGTFRQDLYFRLVGVQLDLPPLRDRLEDVPPLAEHALARIAAEPGMRPVTLTKEATALLVAHGWPGNVRELWQALRRAVLVSDGDTLRADDLALGGAAPSTDRRAALRRFDRDLVERALRAAEGNRSAAARALGVSRMTLHRWIKRYDLD